MWNIKPKQSIHLHTLPSPSSWFISSRWDLREIRCIYTWKNGQSLLSPTSNSLVTPTCNAVFYLQLRCPSWKGVYKLTTVTSYWRPSLMIRKFFLSWAEFTFLLLSSATLGQHKTNIFLLLHICHYHTSLFSRSARNREELAYNTKDKRKPWGILLLLELFKWIYRGHLMRAEIAIAFDWISGQQIFI